MQRILLAIPFLLGFFVLLPSIHAETLTQNLEGGMNVEITYPDEIVVGREGVISILVKNNGWEEKQDVAFVFSVSDIPGLVLEPSGGLLIDKIADGGSYGENVKLNITNDANPGIHFLNIKYSHVLVANNEWLRVQEISYQLSDYAQSNL